MLNWPENMPVPMNGEKDLNLKIRGHTLRQDLQAGLIKIMERLKDKPDGKYIEVTAITPTPLGEGKHYSLGLMEGMGKRGEKCAAVCGSLRGPTMQY